jgi:hypothetical protein
MPGPLLEVLGMSNIIELITNASAIRPEKDRAQLTFI